LGKAVIRMPVLHAERSTARFRPSSGPE